jgi:hypothetical protein
MNIETTIKKYKDIGDYFDPDYERDNDLLSSFKREHPDLSKDQVIELVKILNSDRDLQDKYFVADILYLYDNFDAELFEPLINTSINFRDPSFNRVFLKPCMRVFGVKVVADNLADKFTEGNILQRLGISNLLYHLRPQENGNADTLHKAILKRADETTNLIELYHYKLCYSDRIKDNNKIPNNASNLIKLVKGNKEYEDLLFNKLGWTNKN